MKTLREMWNETCLQADIPSISMDTSARVFAVVYVYGNNEDFVSNENLLSDIEYISKRFGVYGAGVPKSDFAELLNHYIKELEEYEDAHKESNHSEALFQSPKQQWAIDLFRNRYGIKLLN